MHPAPLPARPQKPPVYRPPEATVGIGDDEGHVRKTARDKTGKKSPPEGLVLASAHLKAEHLPFPGLRDAVGDGQGHGHYSAGLISHLLVGGVQPEVGVAAEKRSQPGRPPPARLSGSGPTRSETGSRRNLRPP